MNQKPALRKSEEVCHLYEPLNQNFFITMNVFCYGVILYPTELLTFDAICESTVLSIPKSLVENRGE